MHSERLLDHFQNPRNAGELPAATLRVEVDNPACGDHMRLSARVEEGVIREVRYQVRGCTASIAAGSALTEWLTGRLLTEAAALRAAVIEEALGGLIPESKHAAVLCVDAARELARRA
ncbi:MAG: iron-sulfur cluster assembly scaffold protein [Bryobacterales bacterium]|nr:iron-sulfur cluster assembly scaffold protein [Bryobacterales bacterium]